MGQAMKDIFSRIQDMKETYWNYYSYFNDNAPLNKPFVTDTRYIDFIKRYFKKGGKQRVFNVDKFDLSRAAHTCSIFFLGLILYHETKLNRYGIGKIQVPGYKFFPFIWFLTCLSHDHAYYLEENETLLNTIYDLDTFKKKERIVHDLLKQQTVDGIPNSLFECIGKYFIYRRYHHKVLDHGICAGMLLFDRLVKNRHMQKRNTKDDGLFWVDSLDNEYALASAAVATHNIWLPESEVEKDIYKEFELELLTSAAKISFDNAPLLFLLCLVDTIDPVKLFPKQDEKTILRNIHIGFKNDNKIMLENNGGATIDFFLLKEKAKESEKWLDVSVNIEGCAISITIN